MIEFDPSKLTVNHLKVKSVTTALGGSVRILDEGLFERTGEEKFTKLEVPFAVARRFIKQYNCSKFLQPIETAIVQYDGVVVNLELHKSLDWADKDEQEPWISRSELNIQRDLDNLTSDDRGTWCIDGQMVFRVPLDLTEVVRESKKLSQNGKFRAWEIEGYSLQHLHIAGPYYKHTRQILLYQADNGEIVLTPPVWKSLTSIGAGRLDKIEEAFETDELPIDKIDRFLSVNLSFALYAAKEVSKMYGYKVIAPLQLPELMIRLKTINLPRVPKDVKNTFDIGLPFTHALAWLIGLMKRADSLDDFIKMRAIFKYLTSKGIFHSNMFDTTNVFVDGADLKRNIMKSVDDAKKVDTKSIPGEYWLSISGSMKDTIGDIAIEDD